MSLFLYETKENLPATIINGDVYYTDSGDIYIDKDSKRYKLNLNSLPVTLQNLTKNLTEIKEETPDPGPGPTPDPGPTPGPDPEPKPDNTPYTFAFIADTHQSTYASQLVSSIESKKVSLLAHTGDYVNYGSSSLLKTQVNNYSGNYTYLITRGNHDGTADNTYLKFLTESEVRSAMGQPYYYRDIPGKKIRFIVLNTEDRDLPAVASDPQHYYGIGVSQMKWLCETALQVSEPGWSAILLMHTPLCPLEKMEGWSKIQYNEKTSGYGRWYIASKVISACNNATTLTTAYTEGSANATMNYSFNGNMTIIAALCGHVHADNIVMVNGVPNISIKATSETPCFDLVTVNKDSKTLTLDRYNYSGSLISSRSASWTNPTGSNVGNPEAHVDTSTGTSYTFNCIVFENNLLTYLAADRANANSGKYLYNKMNTCNKVVTIEGNADKDSASVPLYFKNGLLYTSSSATTLYTGKKIITSELSSGSRSIYAIFFQDGKYIGYNSNTSASTYSTAASTKANDFFGVATQTKAI